MDYYLDFYELSCTAKDDLINFAVEDYIKRYGYDEIYNDMMGTDLDYEDVLFNKASEHLSTINIYIKL